MAGPTGYLASVDFDGTLSTIETGTSARLNDVFAFDSGVVAVGDAGTIVRYRDSSGQAELVPSGTSQTLRGVWGTSADDFYAVGDARTLLAVRGGVATAFELPLAISLSNSTAERLTGISGTGPSDVFVSGEQGTILHFDGELWTYYRSSLVSTTRVVATPEVVYFVGLSGLHRLSR